MPSSKIPTKMSTQRPESPEGSGIFQKDSKNEVREIGDQAIWSLSSCKPGFGIDQLRDDNFDTYWQSDGPQPHLVNIQFRRKTLVRSVSIYTDYKSDESYTPSKISVRVGNDFHDLKQIELVELDEPNGWISIELKADDHCIRTFMIQLAVLGNHQNGRDTHIRQIKVFAPNMEIEDASMPNPTQFSSINLSMYSRFR